MAITKRQRRAMASDSQDTGSTGRPRRTKPTSVQTDEVIMSAGDNPSALSAKPAPAGGLGEHWGNHFKEDAALMRQAIRYEWGTPAERAEIARNLLELHRRAMDEGDLKGSVATAKALMDADRLTLSALPPQSKTVEHTGQVNHAHAVVTLPAKVAPALPAPEST